MATSLDNDAVYFSLCIMDAIHRRVFDRLDDNGLIRTAFDEADCLNVLESICESASASVKYGTGRDWDSDNTNTIAEMAANLIDDFYDEAFVEDDGIANTASTFAFGMKDEASHFRFSRDNVHTRDNESNSNGLGRGRGKVVPAWMTNR